MALLKSHVFLIVVVSGFRMPGTRFLVDKAAYCLPANSLTSHLEDSSPCSRYRFSFLVVDDITMQYVRASHSEHATHS
jgi:hypothetical protein